MNKFYTISEYPQYKMDKDGNVISAFSGNKWNNIFVERHKPILLKSFVNCQGYMVVSLSKQGKCMPRMIHKLLALTFIPNPNNYPCINHIDGNKLNNNLDNLEWCTYAHNTKHALRLGLINQNGENAYAAKLRDSEIPTIRLMHEMGFKNAAIGREFNVTKTTIRMIVIGRTWKHITNEHEQAISN